VFEAGVFDSGVFDATGADVVMRVASFNPFVASILVALSVSERVTARGKIGRIAAASLLDERIDWTKVSINCEVPARRGSPENNNR
jgi:hypothetical protein